MRQALSISILLACAAASPLWAVDPNRHISQYAHTAWRVQDGVFSGTPWAIAQTSDGYLWIETATGPVRFDGVRFMPWAALGRTQLPGAGGGSVLGAHDGSLWLITSNVLSRWADQHLTTYPEAKNLGAIVEDHDGSIWIARDGDKLCHLLRETTQCYGKADGINPPTDRLDTLGKDSLGNLWIGFDTGILRWKPGSSNLYAPAGLRANKGREGVTGIAFDADGSVWAGIDVPGPGLGLQHFVQGQWHPFITQGFDSSSLEVRSLFMDSHHALWIGTNTQGVYRIFANQVDHFRAADGLSGNAVIQIFEDHEENVWVVTSRGVDKLSNVPVASYSITEGLDTEDVDAVIATRGGALWIGGGDVLDVIRNGNTSSIQKINGFAGKQVTSLLEDDKRRLWVGINDSITINENRTFREVRKPDGSPLGMVVDMIEDTEKNIWIETLGPGGTLVRIHDDKVQEQFSESRMPAGREVAADPTGGIWIGTYKGNLVHVRNGHSELIDFDHKPNSRVEQLLVDSDGSVLGATGFGIIGWKDSKKQVMTVSNGLPCNEMFAMVRDSESNLWLYTQCGLVEIADTELLHWWQHPESLLKPVIFDEFSGARPGPAPFQKAARTTDGRLWFTNNFALQMIDPHHLYRNTLSPPVHIEGITADRRSYAVSKAFSLPPLTRDVEIDYTALSFMVPQKVRFRYKLDGHDSDWQDPGTRRQAFYNDLGPGAFTFHVIACNNDGLWNEVGASLQFNVVPAWYQTAWFRLLAMVSMGLLIATIYRMRVRSIARAISARFNERLEERTRMALELHDTFLQTVQGSKMVADDALDTAADQERMRHALEKLSVWLEQAVREGRAALHALHVSTMERNHLAEFLNQTAKDHCGRASISVALTAIGDARDLHPIVRDEIARIAEEAIRNACMHSKASLLSIELRYAGDLSLSFKDNGLGIDPEVVDSGKTGHFGLQGMKERSARIRAKITITSTINAGTTITLRVPGSIVYRRETMSLLAKLRTQRPWRSRASDDNQKSKGEEHVNKK